MLYPREISLAFLAAITLLVLAKTLSYYRDKHKKTRDGKSYYDKPASGEAKIPQPPPIASNKAEITIYLISGTIRTYLFPVFICKRPTSHISMVWVNAHGNRLPQIIGSRQGGMLLRRVARIDGVVQIHLDRDKVSLEIGPDRDWLEVEGNVLLAVRDSLWPELPFYQMVIHGPIDVIGTPSPIPSYLEARLHLRKQHDILRQINAAIKNKG